MRSYLSPKLTHSEPTSKKPRIDRFFRWLHTLSASDSLLMRTALLAFGIFFVAFLAQLSVHYSARVAAQGGVFSEGVVGVPRFINPVLAATRADKDLTALIYDGLLRLNADGTLGNNIAESVTVSDDGLTYNVILKKGITFHDGQPLTAQDVAFTVAEIQDPLLNSPLRGNFIDIKTEVVGDYEINFVLPQAYSLFKKNLTFGILPEHIWKGASAEEFPFSPYNNEPVGSGPYKVQKITRSVSGIPSAYLLEPNPTYLNGAPKINRFEIHFFPTEADLVAAFKKGVISSVAGITPESITALGLDPKTSHVERIPLPRTFAVFMNQNKSEVLRDPAVRKALSIAIDRTQLIDTVLGGYGNPLFGPVPPGFGIPAATFPTSTVSNEENARAILRTGGWKLNEQSGVWEKDINGTVTPLSFAIATVNQGSFVTTAEFLKNTWEHMGASVQIDQFEQADLTQGVIRPRNYEALLFGADLGRSLDFYSFWHSSQRNDPGLNVALFANITTDSILSKMRRTTDDNERAQYITNFAQEMSDENPAIFLYAPELLYVFPNVVQGASFAGVSEPQERFARANEWFTETESVWPFFTKQTQ